MLYPTAFAHSPKKTGNSYVVGFDTDADALAIASANCEELEADIDFVLCNFVENPPFKGNARATTPAALVFLNGCIAFSCLKGE